MSIHRSMDKQILVHSYKVIIFSNRKEWTFVTYNNMEESQNNYSEWKKADKNDYIPYDSICIKILEYANSCRVT